MPSLVVACEAPERCEDSTPSLRWGLLEVQEGRWWHLSFRCRQNAGGLKCSPETRVLESRLEEVVADDPLLLTCGVNGSDLTEGGSAKEDLRLAMLVEPWLSPRRKPPKASAISATHDGKPRLGMRPRRPYPLAKQCSAAGPGDLNIPLTPNLKTTTAEECSSAPQFEGLQHQGEHHADP